MDTTEVEKRFKSLSLCLATLTIINGDLSLGVLEIYNNFRVQRPPKPRPQILQSQTEQQLITFKIKKYLHEIERNDSEAADESVTLGVVSSGQV